MANKNGKRVTFTFCPSAPIQKAYLVGDFNNWTIGLDDMKLMDDGSFQKIKILPPGRYEYKFYADGIYWNDPNTDAQVINPFGTLNSVIPVDE
jgi:1,4-alpha-glucan branching enzyme